MNNKKEGSAHSAVRNSNVGLFDSLKKKEKVRHIEEIMAKN